MVFPAPVSLHGQIVTLEPLSQNHHDDLVEGAKDGELWSVWYTQVPTPDEMRIAIDKRLASHANGAVLPFAVIAKETGKAVGMTNFLNIDPRTRRLEIGGTWYRKSMQRTRINTECKQLLLSHAFDNLSCVAVEFRTHFLNRQSRRAIERLGAKLDGVLRNYQLARNGTLKDMCVYSIISAEWPAVSAQLQWLLQAPRAAEN